MNPNTRFLFIEVGIKIPDSCLIEECYHFESHQMMYPTGKRTFWMPYLPSEFQASKSLTFRCSWSFWCPIFRCHEYLTRLNNGKVPLTRILFAI